MQHMTLCEVFTKPSVTWYMVTWSRNNAADNRKHDKL